MKNSQQKTTGIFWALLTVWVFLSIILGIMMDRMAPHANNCENWDLGKKLAIFLAWID